jgi:cobalt transporter subunit CbtB
MTDVSSELRTATLPGALAVPFADRAPALMTIAFGLIVLFCVGFLQTPAAHNGAHDTRHANGFPCH